MRLPLLYPRPRRGLSICPRRRPLNRRGGKDDIDPRALNAHELDGKEAYRSADVESKQCEEIKLHFLKCTRSPSVIYCAKASEACFVLFVENMVELTNPFSSGKGAPLHAHCKEYGIQREDNVCIGRNEAQGNTGKRVDNRRCTAHIDAEKSAAKAP